MKISLACRYSISRCKQSSGWRILQTGSKKPLKNEEHEAPQSAFNCSAIKNIFILKNKNITFHPTSYPGFILGRPINICVGLYDQAINVTCSFFQTWNCNFLRVNKLAYDFNFGEMDLRKHFYLLRWDVSKSP